MNFNVKENHMSAWSLDLSAPAVWAPVEQLLKLHAERFGAGAPSLWDFMYMGSLTASEAETIFLYKHRRTRAYLCLDRAGHTYEIRRTPHGQEVHHLRDAPIALRRVAGTLTQQTRSWRSVTLLRANGMSSSPTQDPPPSESYDRASLTESAVQSDVDPAQRKSYEATWLSARQTWF